MKKSQDVIGELLEEAGIQDDACKYVIQNERVKRRAAQKDASGAMDRKYLASVLAGCGVS